MSEEPSCAARYGGQPTDPVVVVNGGKLANVFVRVTGGLPPGPYPTPATAPEIDQAGCLYHPRVVGAMAGQALTILNSDSLLHNIKAVPTANRGFNVSQPRAGMSRQQVFTEPEIMVPLECNVHGWMKAFVGVVAHPYFATSAEDGTFMIGGLPPGTYQLEAWHESLGTRAGEATIGPDGTGTVTFTFGAP
jgi:plastocyanin